MDSHSLRRLVWLDDHVPQLHRLWLWLFNRAMRRMSRRERNEEQQQQR